MHGFAETRLVRATHRIRTQNVAEAHQTNLGPAGLARAGTTVTAGSTAHTKGGYTELIASTSATGYGLWVMLKDTGASNALRSYFADIALGDAGAETILINNVDGGAGPIVGGKLYYFPGVQIPQGSRISARAQSNVASLSGNIAVWVDFGARFDVSDSVITYGADTANTTGVAVQVGDVDTFGSWAEVGTTSRDHKVFTLAITQETDATFSDTNCIAQMGYGPDAANVTVAGTFYFRETSNVPDTIVGLFPPYIVLPIASGTKLFVRIAGTPNDQRSAIIYGI